MRPALVYTGLALATVVAVPLSIWLFQRRLIYFPYGAAAGRASAVLPGAEDVSFTTEDGIRLAAWWVPAAGTPETTVIVFHGNAGSRAERAALGAGLAARGSSVLLLDYRGYGGNAGAPSETGLLRDARAARAWVESRPGARADRIVYFGESLGAAVAVALAVERPPAALVLRSPFTSLVDAARFHYPFLPVGMLLRESYPSLDRVRGLDCPLLVIAGTADAVVPFEQSRTLFGAVRSRGARFYPIEGADHNDPVLVAGRGMLDEIADFLREAVGAAPAAEEDR